MSLLEPERTQFDLKWRMFGVPIRVHPMFWLFSAILGWNYIHDGLQYVLLWVGCTFVSVLVHEFGHVFMGQLFGSYGHIVLYSFGGLAVGSNQLPWRWQRIAVSFAGPLAGFVLFGLVVLFDVYAGPPINLEGKRSLQRAAFDMLEFMNLFWNLLNLVPIWPLDGGMISREVCMGLFPRNGLRLSLGLSFLLAGLLAVHCLLADRGQPLLPLPIRGMWGVILFAMLAIESFQLLQQAQPTPRRWEEDEEDDARWRRERWD